MFASNSSKFDQCCTVVALLLHCCCIVVSFLIRFAFSNRRLRWFINFFTGFLTSWGVCGKVVMNMNKSCVSTTPSKVLWWNSVMSGVQGIFIALCDKVSFWNRFYRILSVYNIYPSLTRQTNHTIDDKMTAKKNSFRFCYIMSYVGPVTYCSMIDLKIRNSLRNLLLRVDKQSICSVRLKYFLSLEPWTQKFYIRKKLLINSSHSYL